jgi:hypothetical protein
LDLQQLNGKFDEIYERGGIYNFMSHPQWLDYGEDAFFEKHLSHIAKRPDVWYVPMGPLYAFRTIRESTEVRQTGGASGTLRFDVSHKLDRKIYNGSVTLEFRTASDVDVLWKGKPLPERRREVTDRWNEEYFRREGDRLFVTVVPSGTLGLRLKGAGNTTKAKLAATERIAVSAVDNSYAYLT